jgi:protein SCO1/2
MAAPTKLPLSGKDRRSRRLIVLSWALCAVVAVPLVRTIAAQRAAARAADEAPLPELGAVPEFSLTDQEGQPFATDRLRAHVSVVNFMFTSCPTVCPMLSSRMAGLQSRLRDVDGVRHVSFSVDPNTDTPEVLKAYGQRYKQDPARWTFVTGPYEVLETAIVDGFKMHVGREPTDAGDGFYDIVHGEHFVLVDRAGRIRGYYRAENEELERLERDTRRLAAENAP